ncbi:hypothetical protein QBC39DRAFT_393080 [Podospora conica]|nr:hypothetical protein QBC39DRAFT_393080 [Schizothecium conicum]
MESEIIYKEGVKTMIDYRTGFNELLKYTGINAPRVACRVLKIKPSVCFGVNRIAFRVVYKKNNYTVYYELYKPMIFIVAPIVMPVQALYPLKGIVDFANELLNRILAPLRDDQKHDFLWRVGRVFYRHEGKSILLKMLTTLIPDASMWCSNDLFGKNSKWPSSEIITLLAQKRFLICDECEIKDGFSYNNIKRWTSGTPVTLEDGSTCHLSQSAFILTNNIPFNDKPGINNSIGRRLVIYYMDRIMSDYDLPDISKIDNFVVVRFISIAVAVYNADIRFPPTSLPIALYSFFRRNVKKITAGLIYDPGSSEQECMAATWVIAVRYGVDAKTLVVAFTAMSPRLVRSTEVGNGYIGSLRPMKITYTEHGLEVIKEVDESRKFVPNLDELLERIYVIKSRNV